MADTANHIFLPWVQPGVAAVLPDTAKETFSPQSAALLTLGVQLTVNGATVDQAVRLYGPGDVTGLDPEQIVRREPAPRTLDFEPNYFAAIEFDRPDFPWLFTPLKADAQGRLRPWLCLVVVKRQPGVELRASSDGQLPVLRISSPASAASELPDLAESHLWAHAQVSGVAKAELERALANEPARNVSRLICPRRLDAASDYIACVVPSFEVGRKSGLNETVAATDTLLPAWTLTPAPTEVKLPVYHSWEFRTGEGGDFEELVRRLAPRELPPEVGKRTVEFKAPGFVLNPAPSAGQNTRLGLEGALRVLKQTPDAWSDPWRASFQKALQPILNTPWQQATKDGGNTDPVVAPPVYGCWQAAVHEVTAATPNGYSAPAWLNELNLDPRQRSVAAIGTQVIQAQQEALMASAWQQLGDLPAINQRLRQAQLSRAINIKVHTKTFSRLPADAFLRVVSPARSRLLIDASLVNTAAVTPINGKVLLGMAIETSFVPTATVSASLRKLARPRGTINRQYAKAGTVGVTALLQLFNTQSVPATDPSKTRGAITLDAVTDVTAALLKPGEPNFIWIAEPVGHWERVRAGFPELLAGARLAALRQTFPAPKQPPTALPEVHAAAKQHVESLATLFQGVMARDFRFALGLPETRLAALASLNPGRAVSESVLAGLSLTSPPSRTGDELEPVLDAPSFEQPMYEALRDLSQDYLLPGLEHVPPNCVQLLETNGAFIESFMVGLNNEMSRELLWRGFPTDQRGTYFQRFWAAIGPRAPDIPQIHTWGNSALGSSAAGVGGDRLVLLIRGELLRRYPGTIIYALRAGNQAGKELSQPSEEAHPVFRGTLEPDVTFLGFDLTQTKLRTEGNWYFMLQQQPTEPRFGLDDDPFGPGESGKIPELSTWNDLNWAHLASSADALKALSHVAVNRVTLAPKTPANATWGRNSAHMALITKQRPVRVAIRAAELMP